MLNRRTTLATIVALLASLFAATAAEALPTRAPTPPPTDFWQGKEFMNMAHQGGETEAPGNTLYAFKTAIRDRGADTLEMDGYLTEDNKFVITHDLSPNPTSNIAETPFAGQTINQLTLAELKTLDFAHKFSPGKGHYNFNEADPHPYRGMALPDGPAPPAGYERNDFRIPEFTEVLDAFPNTPINVDMKAPGSNPGLAIAAAETVAEIMKDYPQRSDDVIVASFYAPAMAAFHAAYEDHNALTAGEGELLDYVETSGDDPIEPTPVALQPPDRYQFGSVFVDTVPILRDNADYDGFAIHVWPQNGTPDNEETWQKVIDQGADGFFTDKPSALHEYLCETGVPRPDGTPRCAQQICPEGQEGIGPNGCKPIPCPDGTTGTSPNCQPLPGQCPAGTTGTPPSCQTVVVPKSKATVSKVAFAKTKTVKAGKKVKLAVKVTATDGLESTVKVTLKSSNRQVRVPKSLTVKVRPGATVTKQVTVKATRKAKGKATITATAAGKTAKATLKVKRVNKVDGFSPKGR